MDRLNAKLALGQNVTDSFTNRIVGFILRETLAWVPVWSFFLLFYFSVSWSKMTASGTLISIDSATWIFPQILRGKAKNDNSIG